jgi:hypothetical protein
MLLSPDIPTPQQWDIPYEHLTLRAKDGVKIKAYLLIQGAVGFNIPLLAKLC